MSEAPSVFLQIIDYQFVEKKVKTGALGATVAPRTPRMMNVVVRLADNLHVPKANEWTIADEPGRRVTTVSVKVPVGMNSAYGADSPYLSVANGVALRFK